MINFPFGTNGKLIILGVPILKHITVYSRYHVECFYLACYLQKGDIGRHKLLLNFLAYSISLVVKQSFPLARMVPNI